MNGFSARTTNLVFGELPRGCRLCLLGVKSVLFITGLCPLSCPYCPVDRERLGKDVMYINDKPISRFEDIIEEIDDSFSNGIAVTGGEPFMAVERVAEYCKRLKGIYGEEFHIHTYTHALNIRESKIDILCKYIDEVRIHAVNVEQARRALNAVRRLRDCNIEVGVEVPVIPGLENDILRAIDVFVNEGLITFVNLNELDVSPSNVESLRALGVKITEEGRAVGSLEAAFKLAEELRRRYPRLDVHVCTTHTKDHCQIGARLFRRSLMTLREGEFVFDDGSIGEFIGDEVRVKVRIGGREYEFGRW